jgi:hypothetical protein
MNLKNRDRNALLCLGAVMVLAIAAKTREYLAERNVQALATSSNELRMADVTAQPAVSPRPSKGAAGQDGTKGKTAVKPAAKTAKGKESKSPKQARSAERNQREGSSGTTRKTAPRDNRDGSSRTAASK